MLNEKHLAVVRAALKFLDEEISPNGIGALRHYLDGHARDVEIKDIQVARTIFDALDLYYVLVDAAGMVVDSNRLVAASSPDELIFQSDLSLLASVLVPSQ